MYLLFNIFWNIWNLFLWRETGNKWSSCSDDFQYGVFILGQSEHQFKSQSYFGIFDQVFGERQWYVDGASHALKCIYGLFGKFR